MSTSPPGWQPDPRGRHQYRYWDGSQWTDHVADDGEMSTDPVADESPSGSAPATETQPAAEPEHAAAETPDKAEESSPSREPEREDPVAEDPEHEPAAAATPEYDAGDDTAPAEAKDTGEEERRPPFSESKDADGSGSGGGAGAAAETAKAQAQAAMEAKSPDLAVLLSAVAPGSGHLYLGVEPAKRNLAFGLLAATVVAVVLAYMSFVLFLVGFVLWAGSAYYAIQDLSGGDATGRLENASIPQQFVGLLLVVGGVLLIVALLLPWYHVPSQDIEVEGFGTVSSGGGSISGFKVLGIIDILLVLVGVAAVVAGLAAMGVLSSADQLPKEFPTAVAIAGAVALLLVVFRMFFIPEADFTDKVGRAPGILLAASASIVLVMANLSTLRGLRNSSA